LRIERHTPSALTGFTLPSNMAASSSAALRTVPDMAPETLSHYRVLEEIGRGGMGVVYRAHDEQLDRDVALKVLPTGLLADENARRRFRREALALAKLNHPNVGVVYEFGDQGGIDFLVMELVSGISLDAKLAAGPMPEKEILRLGAQFADGLEASHAKGILHRDLKPGNLRLATDGRLKILDFGLAQSMESDTDDATASLTQAKEFSGTLRYMAPEQLRGGKADVRTDIYSAGAVLYEMATGKRVFGDVTGPVLVGAILEKLPSSPSSWNRTISPALESVILKAIDKDPDRRYQSARELRVDLERIGTGTNPVIPVHRARWGILAGAVVGGLVLLAVFNVGGVRDRVMGRGASPAAMKAVKGRRSVAVLGFKNLSGKAEEAWISTALGEMLTTELAAGDQLRTVPGENVARMKIDLSLSDADSFGNETLARIRTHLGNDLVVLGSYLALGKEGGAKIRLDLRLQDTTAGETIASVSESGTEGELSELIVRTGAELRRKLGLPGVSPDEATDVRVALPSTPEAARLYAEGVAKLRVFDALAAKDLLEKAIAADPNHALAHSALSAAWRSLGDDAKSQEEAKRSFDLSSGLARADRLSVEARYRSAVHDWPKAIEIYRSLWNSFPDNLEYGLRLAETQTAGGQGKDSLATLAQLRQLPAPGPDDPRIDLAEARAAGGLGDFHRALESAHRAAEKGRAQGAKLVVAQARAAEGGYLGRLGRPDEATAALSEAKDIFSSAGDSLGSAATMKASGDILYDRGAFAAARKNYEETLLVFRRLGAQLRVADSLNSIGNILYDQGELAAAKKYYEQVLSINREVDDKHGIAGTLGNIANVLDAMGDLEGSRKMQEESLAAFREVGNQRGMASTLDNFGNVLSELGDLAGARRRYEEALAIQRKTDYKRGQGYALQGLADIKLAQGDLDGARRDAEESLALRQALAEEFNVMGSKIQLGVISTEQGRLAEGESLLKEGIAAAIKLKQPETEAQASAFLGKNLLAQNKLKEATEAARRAVALSQKSTSRLPHFDIAIISAQIQAAQGQSTQASKRLQTLLSEAEHYGYVPYVLETRVTLGGIEMKTGSRTAARTLIEAVEKDATAKGYLLIARKAAKARG
jgi:tetratricopeptide (TPR) repeat protein